MSDLFRRAFRLRREQDGVTAVIVALSLIALFGMVVLVVDVGGLLLKRRAMVNGADAAALAAAQTCAISGGTLGSAEIQADTYAGLNAENVTASSGTIVASANCGGDDGYVTVQYTAPQQLFFAPVLGFGTSGNVSADATAAWGPTGSIGPIPIVLNTAGFQGPCTIPLPDSSIGQECQLWFDNDRFEGSNFGFLDLEQWDVETDANGVPIENCNSAGGSNALEDQIDGAIDVPNLGLNFPDPTYVCTTSGNRDSVWGALQEREGDLLYFPINDWDGAVTGFAQVYNNNGTQVEYYNIIGYAGLQLEAVYDANQAGPQTSACGDIQDFDFTAAMGGNVPGPDIDIAGASAGCAPYDTVVNVDVDGQGACCQLDTHYVLVTDQVTGVVTGIDWIDGDKNGVDITWDVQVDGPCGPPPGNASAHCIIVSWQGFQYGGQNPGQGGEFGIRAIALCDRTLSTCPDQ